MIDFCVFVSDIDNALNIDEALTQIPKPSKEVLSMLGLNEKVNQTSLQKIKDYFQKKSMIDYRLAYTRVYFGNETCDKLIPSKTDLEKVLKYFETKGIPLTYVTPYSGPEGLGKIDENLQFLNSKGEFEVVLNDWGVLQLIDKKYPNLTPILGRLMIKVKRDPRFSQSEYSVNSHLLNKVEKVAHKQEETVINSSLDNPEYSKFLEDKHIDRVSMEAVPYGEDEIKNQFKKNKWGLPVDLYWPWTYITSGRNCQVAAHTQPAGKIHPAGKNCYFQCKQFELTFQSDKEMLDSVQRGNALWMNSEKLFESYINLGFDRLVYQPYIPI